MILTTPNCEHRFRRGMTLMEIMVAIGIVVMLAGMVVAFYPGVQEGQRSAQAGTLVESWLRQAKSRAARDQMVRGLRLIINPANYQVSQCQLLDQLDDYFIPGSPIVSMTGVTITFNNGTNPTTGLAIVLDFFNGSGGAAATEPLWEVQPGDFLEVNGNGQMHLITGVSASAAGGPGNTLTLQPTINATIAANVAAAGSATTPVAITLSNCANVSLGSRLDIYDPTGKNILDTVTVQAMTTTVVGASVDVLATVVGMTHAHTVGNIVQSHGISAQANTGTWRVLRAPRVAGDEQMSLPNNSAANPTLVIDLSLNQNFNGAFASLPSLGGLPAATIASYENPLPITNDSSGNPLYFDILFAPSGTVVTPGVSTNFLALWVRDLNGNNPFQLGPTLIAVHVRSGLISAHPPNDAVNGNPYQFVIDGRSQ